MSRLGQPRPFVAASLSRLVAVALALLLASAAKAEPAPPSPHRLLSGREPSPGFVDAAAACLPGSSLPDLRPSRELARAGEWNAAAQSLRSLPAAAGANALERTLLQSVIAAHTEPDLRGSLAELLEAVRAGGAPESLFCAHLERARLELRAGLFPEARVSTLRAERDLPPASRKAEQVEALAYLRAEATWLRGRPAEARGDYESLTSSTTPAIASVAAARIALLDAPGRDPLAALTALKLRVEAVRRSGLDENAWAGALGEAAIRAGRFDEAHVWLALAADQAGLGGPETIRRADALMRAGRTQEARQALLRLAEGSGFGPSRVLARVRLAAFDLLEGGDAERLRVLRHAVRTEHPRIAAHALDVLGHLLAEQGDIDAALDARARLLREDLHPELSPHLAPDLASLLRTATGSGEPCSAVVARLGGSSETFLAAAPWPAAHLRLGDCQLELGMAGAALATYRAVSRRYGSPVAGQLTLRMARASLENGEREAARAALEASLRRATGGDRARWLLLEARLHAIEERPLDQARSLRIALEEPGLPDGERRRGLLALARLTQRLRSQKPGADADVEAFGPVARAALAREDLWPSGTESLHGEVALALADLAGGEDVSDLYRLAASLLPNGWQRDRAAFRAGSLELQAAEDPPSGWARVVGLDGRAASLRESLGRDGSGS